MADPLEILPLLVFALVLLSAGGADVSTVDLVLDDDHLVTENEDVLIVGGGSVTVPEGERIDGPVYVIGGETDLAGTVEGDVVQLAGSLRIPATGGVTAELRTFAGDQVVSEDATIGRRVDVAETLPTERSLANRLGFVALQVVVLGLAAFVLGRRRPTLLANVADAATDHGVVSATVGALASATGVALVVFMALTVLLLPVSLLGLLFGVVLVGYTYVVFGYVVGQWLPIDPVGYASAAGVTVFVLGLEALGLLPVIGPLVQLTLVLVGIGAVLVSFFGLREFEPVSLPG